MVLHVNISARGERITRHFSIMIWAGDKTAPCNEKSTVGKFQTREDINSIASIKVIFYLKALLEKYS